MKRIEHSIIFGTALICIGTLFLLQNLGLLGAIAGLLWALLFATGGVAFLLAFVAAPARWWALIPGFTLLSLGALIGLHELAPALAGPWGGALFLGGISLGFFAVDLTDRRRWWALVPAGVLLTTALVAGLSAYWSGPELGWVFFLGLALTFGLIALVPTPQGRMRWAWFPAGVMLAMALLGMAFTSEIVGIFWPAIMILAGLFLAARAMRPTQPEPIVLPQPEAALVPNQHRTHEGEPAIPTLPPDDLQPRERVVGEPAVLEEAHEEVL